MWQPIETAPRDQTFLAVLNCAGEQTICTMRWPVAEAKNSRPDNKTFHVERVTHWMPLPDLPGAQPAPSVAEQDQINAEAAIRSIYGARPNDEALWQIIVNGMITPAHIAQAVADGTITPAYIMQPAPSVPEGFSREDLEAVAAGLDGYEKTVNVGNVTGEGDDHLESTTAYAARFIRTMLAAAPEAKS